MTTSEIAESGRRVYETRIRPLVEPGNKGRYVVIDVESGDYEIGEDVLSPLRTMRDRHPDGLMHVIRIGYPVAGRIGGRAAGAATT